MKAIMVMYDSLNRHMLSPYGCDWVRTPNFQRLAQRAVTFDRSFVGSMPCMPARRELHTGRYNFLHRSWGPIEPYDDSMPELLKQKGVHTHLISDHYHYWEEGGCNYHTRYKTWEIVRGQEGDPWKCRLGQVEKPEGSLNEKYVRGDWTRQDWVNRLYMTDETDHYQARTFHLGLEFLEENHSHENWFLQIETFDPHEPYFTYEKYLRLYPDTYKGPHFDWPKYGRVDEPADIVQHIRFVNAALVTMCDHYLGKVLDAMDRYDLWRDTLLIVNTDHGFMLGEHDWWAKCVMPFYNEVAWTPLFIWDPRIRAACQRRKSLVQTIDLPATLLEFFGVELPPDMEGKPLRSVIERDESAREGGLFGLFGAHVNVTDGRYVYMRAPATSENQPLFEYTHMPTHMRRTFSVEEMRQATMAPPFRFSKGCPLMKIPSRQNWIRAHEFGTMLFDIDADPRQERPLKDPVVEKRMIDLMIRLMRANDAPAEQYDRLGLSSLWRG